MIDAIDWQEVLDKLKIHSTNLIIDLIMIAFVLMLASIALKVLSSMTGSVIKREKEKGDDQRAKTIITSMTVLRSISRYTIYFIAICIIINQLGYGSVLSNVVTAAGVGALVISLGAQSVISDVIAGAFILFEKQYAVGDYVQINDWTGTVTSIAMRCTYLETWKGEKVIIPNGQVKTVVNYSGPYNMAEVNVPTPYEEDSDKVLKILKEVADEYYKNNRDICYDEPNVLAITSFDSSSVTMSIYLKAVKRNHFRIQRELKMAIKNRFDKEGISIPYQQIVIREEKQA